MNSTQPQASILAVDGRQQKPDSAAGTVERHALKLVTAKSGDEALRCVVKEDFAVILMDARMPGVDGFEAARLIRERERSRIPRSSFSPAPTKTRLQ